MKAYALLFTFILIITLDNNIFAKKINKVKINQENLQNFEPQFLDYSFWLKKIKNPNKIIWSRKKIQAFNKRNLSHKTTLDPLVLGDRLYSRTVKNYFDRDLAFLERYIKYDVTGKRRRDPKFLNFLKKIINYNYFKTAKTIKVEYGLVIDKNTDLRYFPTDLKIFRRKSDREFEILKKTHLPPLTPVAILHQSTDGQWIYVESIFSRGWIKKKFIYKGSLRGIRNFLNQKNQGVVIDLQAEVYRDPQNKLSKVNNFVFPLGSKVFYQNFNPNREFTPIYIPNKDFKIEIFYILTQQISSVYLDFNYSNIIKQAFKFLKSKYLWGGAYDKTDCSLFLYRLYRSFGIDLPRSSVQQIRVLANQKVNNNYNKIILNLKPLLTFAYIPGPAHILLYLGNHNQTTYYIQSTWSYNGSILDNQENILSSVVISDLSLGTGSHLGSLLQKISILGSFIEF